PPNVVLAGIDGSAVTVELQFRVTSPAQRGAARTEVIDLVYRHCKANGLQLAFPPESPLAGDYLRSALRPAMPPAQSLIDAISIFSLLSQEAMSSPRLPADEPFPRGPKSPRKGGVSPAS
ncbi:MAG: small mechanosensitive ion channel, partial [Rhizobium altiplani]